jgi:hypothetical protein
MDGFGKVEGDALVPTITLIELITHSDGAKYPMLFDMKTFLLKPIYTTNLHYVYLGLIFFGDDVNFMFHCF